MLVLYSWRTVFPALAGISDTVSSQLDRRAMHVRLRKDAFIFGPQTQSDSLLLLVSGTVRVEHRSETGDRLVSYRVQSGDACALTDACLLAYEEDCAEGIAETDVEAIMIPRDTFDALMTTSREFRAFVFKAYSKRLTDLFSDIEQRAVQRYDDWDRWPAPHTSTPEEQCASGSNFVQYTGGAVACEWPVPSQGRLQLRDFDGSGRFGPTRN